jgi:hypothetical protein
VHLFFRRLRQSGLILQKCSLFAGFPANRSIGAKNNCTFAGTGAQQGGMRKITALLHFAAGESGIKPPLAILEHAVQDCKDVQECRKRLATVLQQPCNSPAIGLPFLCKKVKLQARVELCIVEHKHIYNFSAGINRDWGSTH